MLFQSFGPKFALKMRSSEWQTTHADWTISFPAPSGSCFCGQAGPAATKSDSAAKPRSFLVIICSVRKESDHQEKSLPTSVGGARLDLQIHLTDEAVGGFRAPVDMCIVLRRGMGRQNLIFRFSRLNHRCHCLPHGDDHVALRDQAGAI